MKNVADKKSSTTYTLRPDVARKTAGRRLEFLEEKGTLLVKTGGFDQEIRLLARAQGSKDVEKFACWSHRNSVVLRTARLCRVFVVRNGSRILHLALDVPL